MGLQAFVQGADEQEVLLIALGTVTETSELCSGCPALYMPPVWQSHSCDVFRSHGEMLLHRTCLA